jgi:hypothetical protein
MHTRVPSTDVAPSLRIEYRRANVAAFWILGGLTLYFVLGAAGTLAGARAAWTLAASVVMALLLPGVVWRAWRERGIWVWNGCMHYLCIALSAYILRVTYLFLLAPLGASYSSLDLSSAKGQRSEWIKRQHATDEAVSRRGSGAHENALHQGLSAFARTPGNRWALGLFPLIFLLALLRDTRQEATPPGSTYTLY